MFFVHHTSNGDKELDEELESRGTKRYMGLATILYDLLVHGSISLLEWKHIGTHLVIPHIGKMPFGPCPVIDKQTSIFKNLHLLIDSLWRFITQVWDMTIIILYYVFAW